jgi:tetratricopeptide (TPR) repeat protein
MSLLGKLFGARSPEEERAHADELFKQEEFGAAKLAYERAGARAKHDAALREQCARRAAECCDAIARGHLREAERLIAQGQVELAQEELRQVKDTAADPQLAQRADEQLEQIERVVVQAEQAATPQPDDDDRFELIAGGFENDQYAEYLAHGEPIKRALLCLHDGDTATARALLEGAIEGADAPRFLWFELGRARVAEGDLAGGQLALENFLKSLHEDEGGDARLLAQIELAQLAHARGDFDAAVAHHESALAALPEDPRPYLAMANYFRRESLAEEAIEVLEAGIDALEGKPPDVRLWQELGLALADAGRDDAATEWLERVVAWFSSQKQTDLPPEGAVRLAALYERSERPARALDLYALLSRGSDRANLHRYHEQAARLLTGLEMHAEARRMLLRARELAPSDPAEQARIAAALDANSVAVTQQREPGPNERRPN